MSRNLEMPRDAVRRKLQRLIEIGLIERIDHRYYMTAKANAASARSALGALSQSAVGHKRSVQNGHHRPSTGLIHVYGAAAGCAKFSNLPQAFRTRLEPVARARNPAPRLLPECRAWIGIGRKNPGAGAGPPPPKPSMGRWRHLSAGTAKPTAARCRRRGSPWSSAPSLPS